MRKNPYPILSTLLTVRDCPGLGRFRSGAFLFFSGGGGLGVAMRQFARLLGSIRAIGDPVAGCADSEFTTIARPTGELRGGCQLETDAELAQHFEGVHVVNLELIADVGYRNSFLDVWIPNFLGY